MMNVEKETGEIKHVMLRAAKHLRRWHATDKPGRCFAALSMTWASIPQYFLKSLDRVLERNERSMHGHIAICPH